jgi:YhcH/YjgK/YiaL family protein
MIHDNFINIEKYKSISQNIASAIDFLISNDLDTFSAGKYEIHKDKVIMLVNNYQTKSSEECKLEAHKKYIDIQLMLIGNEKIGHFLLENESPSEEYSEEKDVMFFKEEYSSFQLRRNEFAIFFPNDVHMPGIVLNSFESVTKIVMKVKVE